jgi:hypothetical protein
MRIVMVSVCCCCCYVVSAALTDLRTVESLDHYEVPFFGTLANRFVDDE